MMTKLALAVCLAFGLSAFAAGKKAPAKAAQPAAEHKNHADHEHKHGKDCGHKAETHGTHTDYEHDGHHHMEHEGHYDECNNTHS
jgi:hypothetical protein